MSRIGKKPITIPSAVTLTQDGQKISAKGPKGELNFTLPEGVTGKIDGDVKRIGAPLGKMQEIIKIAPNRRYIRLFIFTYLH